jgi:hypothetical protein
MRVSFSWRATIPPQIKKISNKHRLPLEMLNEPAFSAMNEWFRG